MKTEAKYRFVGIDDDAKTKSVNLPHAAATADTTKMKALLNAYNAAADFAEVIQVDHIKTETTTVTTD